MISFQEILANNQNWAYRQLEKDPGFFYTQQQLPHPEILWIGCTEHRVPPHKMIGLPSERVCAIHNIANVVSHTDLGLMSILDYAVSFLKVNHIILCGHDGCGGVKAAVAKNGFGVVGKWLRSIREFRSRSKNKPLNAKDNSSLSPVELNVEEQILDLARTSIIQNAWKEKKLPHLHGLVYDPKTGLLRRVVEMIPGTPVDDVVIIR